MSTNKFVVVANGFYDESGMLEVVSFQMRKDDGRVLPGQNSLLIETKPNKYNTLVSFLMKARKNGIKAVNFRTGEGVDFYLPGFGLITSSEPKKKGMELNERFQRYVAASDRPNLKELLIKFDVYI